MKKKTVIISVIIIIIMAIIILGILRLVSGVKEDQEITSEKANEILESYTKFDAAIQEFAELRNTFYKSKENTYLEELGSNYEGWNNLMNNYEKSIKKIEEDSEVLKENCIVKFANVNVNSKCTNFKANYEAAMNYYITDVNIYNKMAKEYNEWNTKSAKNYGSLNEAELVVYKKYIDFDKDGEYFGKEEITNE